MDEIITIDLFGEEFRFKSEGQVVDAEIIVDNLMAYVESAQNQFREEKSHRSKLAILIVAAMNITKDYQELKLKMSRMEKEVETGLYRLNQMINTE